MSTKKTFAVGNIALTESSKKKVQLSVVVKNEVMKAIELDDKNDTAHHLLARWHRGVANLSWIERGFAKIFYGGLPSASHEEAIEHFKEAVKILPTYINHRLELARTYQETKKWEYSGTGRRTGFKIPRGQPRVGSIPTSGTTL